MVFVSSPDPNPVIAGELPAPASKPWFVYLVRAANGALYCGISDDPQRRFAQHQAGKGARFAQDGGCGFAVVQRLRQRG